MQVLNEVLDGDVSDLDLTDDEEGDPTFEVQNVQASEEEDDEEDDDDENNTNGTTNEGRCVTRRNYWKKSPDFWPLPPAPDYEEPPSNGINLPPHEYFFKYVPHDIIDKLCTHTNQRFLHDTGRVLNCSVEEMKKFLGITIIMSYLKYPRIRMYWAWKTRVPVIYKHMARNRYLLIRNNLKVRDDHTATAEEKETNRFWKVQPLIQSVQNGCKLNPRSSSVSIDEQMVPFWGSMVARQFVRGKPNPCGLKNFVATAPDGLPLDFFLYQGKGDTITDDDNYKHLDIGGKAIMHLTSSLPKGITIYMDRYFTSVPLLDTLHAVSECQGTGTLQKNRIPKECHLKTDNVMRREGRGSVDQAVRNDGQIAIIKWFDNRPVTLISSKQGKMPQDQCRRWSKKDREYIMVNRPAAVKDYNANMGGVDFLDRVISTYRISARTKKWTIRLIMHLLDFSLAASWIEYRRDQKALHMPKKDILDYLEFRVKVEEHLIHSEETTDTDSDPDFEPEGPPVKHPKATVPHPPDALRKKKVLHMPEFTNPPTKNRCRLPGCNANKARIRCSTCKVFLCLQDSRNCFKLYHDI